LTLAAAFGQERVYRLGSFAHAPEVAAGDVVVSLANGTVNFEVGDARTAAVQVQISDAANNLLFDSGVRSGNAVFWDGSASQSRPLRYRVSARDASGRLLGTKIGELNLTAPAALAPDVPGNFTIGGYLGVGTDTPQRAVHLKGPNAVFRMDRTMDTAAFILTRIDDLGNIWKSFVVGVDASGPNQGQFIINDTGAQAGGAGLRRMTITNEGDTLFGGSVTATQYFVPSSARFKTNIQTLEEPLVKLEQLRGVRFDWKDTGRPSLGVIAEEVAKVIPEAVSWDENHTQVVGVNYDSLVALLVEATKAQQNEIKTLTTEIDDLTAQVKAELEKSRKGAKN